MPRTASVWVSEKSKMVTSLVVLCTSSLNLDLKWGAARPLESIGHACERNPSGTQSSLVQLHRYIFRQHKVPHGIHFHPAGEVRPIVCPHKRLNSRGRQYNRIR